MILTQENINKLIPIFFEIGIISIVVFFTYLFQRRIQLRFHPTIIQQKNLSWSQLLRYRALSFIAPCTTFILLSFAMAINSHFSQNPEIYRISLKLTLVWIVWIFAFKMIEDLFVRWIVLFTLIPFLSLSAFRLANPIINYLDSLAFSLGEINVSIFLILKGLFFTTCLLSFARLFSQCMNSYIENQKKINPQVRDLMQNISQGVLYTAVGLIAIDLIGIDLKSLAIVGGAVGIGIGLGLQRIAANFISGIIILCEQKVKVGHFIEISGMGRPGWILHLGARAAVVDTGDGKVLLIPNEELLTKTLIDWTSNDRKARVDLQVKVSVRSNLEKAKSIMLDAVMVHPIRSKNVDPVCYLEKFTDGGAQFLLQFWVNDLAVGKMDIQNDVLLKIWKRFAEEDIEFASPPMLSYVE